MYERFAQLYDTFMTDVDYEAWAQYLCALYARRGKGIQDSPAGFRTRTKRTLRLFDAACGTGGVTLPLAEQGYAVTGADLSEQMLFLAGEKARRRGLSVPFVRQDLRALCVPRPVDVVNCACDGVNYLTSRAALCAFFRSSHAALKPGGLLLFDVSTRFKLSEVLGGNCFGEDLPECTYLWRNAYDPETKLLEMRLNVFTPEPDGRYRRFDEVHIQRAHSDAELRSALSNCGFAVLDVFDDLTDAPCSERSERALYVCRRQDG